VRLGPAAPWSTRLTPPSPGLVPAAAFPVHVGDAAAHRRAAHDHPPPDHALLYFALRQFTFGRGKVLGLAVFAVVVAGAAYGLYFFSKQAYVAFPKITETTIPAIVNFAEKQAVELPFTDYTSLRQVALTEARDRFGNIGRYARDAAFVLVYLVIGMVVAVSLFINARLGLEDEGSNRRDNLYSLTAREIATRFVTFYRSFAMVMGAQILISAINTI
jgi:hypothetical protein